MKTNVDYTIPFIYVQQFTVALHGRKAETLINEALSTNKADYEWDEHAWQTQQCPKIILYTKSLGH